MKRSGYNKVSIVVICILVLLTIVIGIFVSKNDKARDAEFKNLKSNAFNTFKRTTVLDSEMASLYFTDYWNLLMNDIDKAYDKLDSIYKQNKFSTVNSFLQYMKNLNFEVTITSSHVEVIDNNYVYHVKVNPNVEFIFSTTGVMEYTVTIK